MVGHRTSEEAQGRHVVRVLAAETERSIQRGRIAALLLSGGLLVSFGDDRSVRMTLAVALLAVTVLAVFAVLRRPRPAAAVRAVGWLSFAGDATVCALALSAVADDPVDPVSAIALMVAVEAAVRWGGAGAVAGGLVAGVLDVGWARAGYAAIGRDLPATSIAFRLLVAVVITLPVGLLVDRLRRQRAHTHHLFEQSDDATMIVAAGRVVAVNPAMAALLDTTVEQLQGHLVDERVGPALGLHDLQDGTTLRSLETTSRSGRPARRWVQVRVEAGPDTGLVFVVVRDVTDQREREERLRQDAWRDPLTGLPNREAMRQRMEAASDDTRGLVFLDLDGFKQVNDRFGHLAGDAVLLQVAERLRGVTRERDEVYRWAGDEFCLLVEPASEELLANVAGRVDDAFAHPFAVEGTEVVVRASVGTSLARAGETPQQVIARADAAMYEGKPC